MSKEISQSMRFFDLNDEREGLAALDAMSGISTLPTSEIVPDEANGGTPLADSISLIQFRETGAYSEFLQGVENIKNDLKKKSKDLSLGRDQRLSSLDQLQGIETVMVYFGSLFAEAEQRVNQMDNDQKLLVGPEGRREITEAASKPPQPASIEKNTAAAIAFLSKKPSN